MWVQASACAFGGHWEEHSETKLLLRLRYILYTVHSSAMEWNTCLQCQTNSPFYNTKLIISLFTFKSRELQVHSSPCIRVHMQTLDGSSSQLSADSQTQMELTENEQLRTELLRLTTLWSARSFSETVSGSLLRSSRCVETNVIMSLLLVWAPSLLCLVSERNDTLRNVIKFGFNTVSTSNLGFKLRIWEKRKYAWSCYRALIWAGLLDWKCRRSSTISLKQQSIMSFRDKANTMYVG